MRHWGKHRLGELVEILSGFAFDSEKFGDSGEMPIVRIRDVVRGRSSTFYNGEYDKKYVLRDGDMLIGMDGEFNLAKWQGGPAVLNQRVCRIAASNGSLDDGYLFRFLPAALKAIEDVTPYVTVKHLSVKTIRDIEIPLPPLAEQRRIAEVLDRAEALRAKRRAALAQLDSLTQSLFLDLLRQAGKDVATVSIEDGMEAIIDYRGKSPTKTESGVPLVTARVVKGGELLEPNEFIAEEDYDDWMRRGFPKAGDVLFTTEAPLGEVAQLDGRKVALAQRLLVLRGKPSLLDNTFLMHAMTAQVVRDQINARATGSTVRGIRQRELRKVMLPVPPIPLQREFARRVTAVEALKTAQRASLAELDALFATLQHRAFRGEL